MSAYVIPASPAKRFAQIEYFKAERSIDCRNSALNNIVNIGLIAGSFAIAKQWERFAFEEKPCEFMNGHFGPLTWALCGKEAETRYGNSVQMMVNVGTSIRRHT